MNLPDYNFISAPLWLITVLHVVTLSLHFVAMNFLFGGLIVILFGKLDNKWQDPTVKDFVKLFPTAVAATVTLGVAPLLFLQLTYYQQAYSAAITSAWFWIGIVDAVIIGYYFLYGAAFSTESKPQRLPVFLTIALVCLLYVSFVYSTVFSMAEHPGIYQALYAGNQSGFVVNTDAGSWVLRWLHMLLGAVTVGGFFVGFIGKNNGVIYSLGKRFFLWGMIATMVTGLVYLLTLGEYLAPLMRAPAIWLVTLGFLLSLVSLHFFSKKKFIPSAMMVFVSMVGMVAARHNLRLIILEGEFDPATIPVNPQWSVFAMFLICFVIAIGLVAYMLKLYFSSTKQTA